MDQLVTGSFIGTTGQQNSYYQARIYWEQNTIDGDTSNTRVTARMYFYHQYEWHSVIKANGKTHITINGNRKELGSDANVSGGGGEYYVMEHTVTVPSSTTSIVISGRCDIGKSYDTPIWYGVEGSKTVSLKTPVVTPITPATPTSCSASGRYEVGEDILVKWEWDGIAGTVTEYEVQYSQYDYGKGEWTSWSNTVEKPGPSKSLKHHIGSVGLNRDRLTYRVRAVNKTVTSGWSTQSNSIFHYGVKVNKNGFKWGTVKVFKEGTWKNARVKVYKNGSWTNAK